jgi:hypothetical protein
MLHHLPLSQCDPLGGAPTPVALLSSLRVTSIERWVFTAHIAQENALQRSTNIETMASLTEAIDTGLQRLEEAKKLYLAGEANATEAILDAAQAILAAGRPDQSKPSAVLNSDHEKPSDFLQRVMWAEVSGILIISTCATSIVHGSLKLHILSSLALFATAVMNISSGTC